MFKLKTAIAVTVARFIVISRSIYLPLLNVSNRPHMIDMMCNLVRFLTDYKYDKHTCRECVVPNNKTNIGYHALYEIAYEAESLVIEAMSKQEYSVALNENFLRIFDEMLIGLSKLSCTTKSVLQNSVIDRIQNLT